MPSQSFAPMVCNSLKFTREAIIIFICTAPPGSNCRGPKVTSEWLVLRVDLPGDPSSVVGGEIHNISARHGVGTRFKQIHETPWSSIYPLIIPISVGSPGTDLVVCAIRVGVDTRFFPMQVCTL